MFLIFYLYNINLDDKGKDKNGKMWKVKEDKGESKIWFMGFMMNIKDKALQRIQTLQKFWEKNGSIKIYFIHKSV